MGRSLRFCPNSLPAFSSSCSNSPEDACWFNLFGALALLLREVGLGRVSGELPT
jgi:hypothetical protein